MSRIFKIFKIVRIYEQGLLNYGGPKLWKKSGSGDPDLQGA